MKTNKFRILATLLGFIILAFPACQPDEFQLGDIISKGELKYSITQNAEDPNMIILKSENPGLTPLWITPMGRSTRVQDTVRIPFAGNYNFIYGVQSPGGFVQADTFKLNLTTSNLMYVNDPLWTLLSGGVDNEKTWLLDLDADGVSKFFNGPLYFYGTDDSWLTVTDGIEVEGDSWNWQPDWAGNSWIMPQGDYGTMTFNLKGNAQVIVDHKMLGRVETGTYFLDATAKTLRMTDAGPLHDANRDGQVIDWGVLKVMSLTENTMQLAALRDPALSGEDAVLLVYNYISKDYADNWSPGEEVEPDPPYSGDANSDLTTNISTSKTWKVDINYPYNWHALDGSALNVVATTADQGEFAFTTWTPPYNADIFGAISISMTKEGDNTGSYVIETSEQTYEGSYEIDDKNNINFGQPINFFSGVGGWLSFGTTDDNSLRIIMADRDALGNITGLWLGKRDPTKAEYLSLHLKIDAAAGGGDDLAAAIKSIICSKTWKLDSERTYDKTTSWGAEQGPIIFSDYSSWSWNPMPGGHYAAGEANVDYGTLKFQANGRVVINQRKRIYTYESEGETLVRRGLPEAGDILESNEIVTLNGLWIMDLENDAITLSVPVLHPWTCNFAVADWGELTIYRIEENALLLQVMRSEELSGEGAMPLTYIFVPASE